ncbi:sensor histidine kinase [Marinoscillum furvescens]|uniref:Signal transduction histidine kinase n=1 Tax=Marinoscillum furvescens DSM 4134 TaxID=1122208 RepID=A0A3D9L0K4_MARFU|nr:sensor histidine kinase [Marinoscillum furvescens]RED96983.1 signal transduction histidine kinase [Marinoscillum furvescens DSM 4134]
MIKRFVNYFIPEERQENAEEHRQYKIVVYFVFVTSLFDLNYISLSTNIGFDPGVKVMAITGFLHLLQLPTIKWKMPLIWVSNLYIAIGAFGVLGCAYYSGGFYSPVIVWLVSQPIVALLMAGKPSGIVWTSLNSLILIVAAIMTSNGYEWPMEYDRSYETFFIANTFVGLVVIIFVVALVFENGKNTAFKKLAEKNILLAEEKKKTALYALSQEIHDDVGQTLFLARLNLSTFGLKDASKDSEKVKSSMELLGQAIDKLRDISSSLNEENISNFSLINSLTIDLETIQNIGAIKTKLYVEGEVQKLNPKTEFVLYRISQEVINNVIKHAQATQLCVDVTFAEGMVELKFSDNGVGMASDHLSYGGQGMRNMRERAASIQGDLHIRSEPDAGTEVHVQAPFFT